MKKLFSLGLILTAVLVSCSEYSDIHSPEAEKMEYLAEIQPEIIQISQDVNNIEVDNILASLFDNSNKSRSNDYEIKVIKDKAGKDCIIRINYDNGNGFALISATKTHEPILAYGAESNFGDESNLPFPLNEWFSSMLEGVSESYNLPEDSIAKISNAWHSYEVLGRDILSRDGYDPDHSYLRRLSQQEVDRLTSIAMDSINYWRRQGYRVYPIDNLESLQDFPDRESIAQFMMGILYPDYAEDYFAISYVVEKDIKETYGAGHCMKSVWAQDHGFNLAFPPKPENPKENIPVGCGPLAVGQIMYYYQHPATFNWSDMYPTLATLTTSQFLYDVYLKCKAKYKDSETHSNQNDREAALKAYGYDCKQIQAKEIDVATLIYGSPALIASYYDNDQSRGHAWIIEGFTQTKEYTETQIFSFVHEDKFESVYYQASNPPSTSTRFYANWGNGGKYNGFYSFQHMVPADHNSNTFSSALINIRKK